MTDHGLDLMVGGPSRLSSALLNVAGVVVVGFFLVRQGLLGEDAWVIALTSVAMLGWLGRSLSMIRERARIPGAVAAVVAIVAGSLVVVPTDVLGYIPALVCLGAVISSPSSRLAIGLSLAGASLVLASVTVIADGRVSPNLLLGAGAGLLIASLIGLSRRQSRTASLRQRELLEERARLGEQQARTAALAERSRIARDIHDVLAHSLGGLVLQLDAIDALLESGRTEDARVRVTGARGLAASGLDDARRAVDALRDPETADDLRAALGELLATHRSLGASATMAAVRSGPARPLPPEAAGAIRRAVQEALSNARRHAPGQTTEVTLTEGPDAVKVVVATPLAPDPVPGAGAGGGRGLLGLRERVEALDGSAEWGVRGGVFTVTASVPIGRAA